MPYYHGIKVTEISTGARAITALATAVIGLVATAADADAVAFPLDTPVLVTDVTAAIGKAGTAGTLANVLGAIADQCNPIVVVVRVAEGADAAATETNVIGTTDAQGERSGLQALLGAESLLGVRPRILGVPGLDTQAVATELAVIAQKLRAFAYVSAEGDTVAEVIAYRANFSAREMMIIWPDFTDFGGSAIARALGLRAKIDEQVGWHKTLSNMAVDGVTGISKAVPFDMVSSTNDAALLNDADVTTLIRAKGFRFWGNHTCSADPLFQFESAARTAQVLQDTIAKGLVWAIDKPITGALVKDILETVNAAFRRMQSQGLIIGARAWFDPSANGQTDLAAGRLTIDYEYTPCAPAESIQLNQRITDKFYASLADQLG